MHSQTLSLSFLEWNVNQRAFLTRLDLYTKNPGWQLFYEIVRIKQKNPDNFPATVSDVAGPQGAREAGGAAHLLRQVCTHSKYLAQVNKLTVDTVSVL